MWVVVLVVAATKAAEGERGGFSLVWEPNWLAGWWFAAVVVWQSFWVLS